MVDALKIIPGIHHILFVEEYIFGGFDQISRLVFVTYSKLLFERSFCIRVKRRGQHNFTSMEVERYVGANLIQNIPSAKVNLNNPDITINLEIDNNKFFIVKSRIQGIGGFPISTQEDVLSLISGGYDSGVASYMMMRRGCKVHYCFFNLGGVQHELGVKKVAYHLWHRFGRSHKVYFISIDFLPIVNEILKIIDDSYIGVVLKRMMVRTATKIAKHYSIQALVTGEALGQVSSQTLTNLSIIDNVTDTLILRPLISYDKEIIIKISRDIGIEDFVRTIPEFCGIISRKPTVKAVNEKIIAQESNFDFSLLDYVINTAQYLKISDLLEVEYNYKRKQEERFGIEIVNKFSIDDIIVDIRPPYEQEASPSNIKGVKVILIPFYKLKSQFINLPKEKTYLLYCENGVMSRVQALYLSKQGFKNIKVYIPDPDHIK